MQIYLHIFLHRQDSIHAAQKILVLHVGLRTLGRHTLDANLGFALVPGSIGIFDSPAKLPSISKPLMLETSYLYFLSPSQRSLFLGAGMGINIEKKPSPYFPLTLGYQWDNHQFVQIKYSPRELPSLSYGFRF